MRLSQVIQSFSSQMEADGLSLKSADLAHIQRLGQARMMRVPAPETPFIERASAFQRALKRQLEGDSYDLVHAGDAWAGAVAAQHKEQAEFRLVMDLTDLPTQSMGERFPGLQVDEKVRQIIRRGETLAIQRADALVVSSRAALKVVVAAGAQESRVHVIPPGVDETLFTGGKIELRVQDGTFSVLYAGVADPGRGLTPFLHALRSMPPPVRGVLLRRNAREAAAEEAIAALGLGERVTWLEATTHQQMAAAYQAVDVVVLLPHAAAGTVCAANTPQRMLEAMACRRPVVVGDTAGTREVATDRDTALVVPSRDPRALGGALHLLLTDGTLREKLARRAGELANEHTWRARHDDYARLYQKLLGVPFTLQNRASSAPFKFPPRKPAPPSVGIARDERAAPKPAPAAPAPVPVAAATPPPPTQPAPQPLAANTPPTPLQVPALVPIPDFPAGAAGFPLAPALSEPSGVEFGAPTTVTDTRPVAEPTLSDDGSAQITLPPMPGGMMPPHFLTEATPAGSGIDLPPVVDPPTVPMVPLDERTAPRAPAAPTQVSVTVGESQGEITDPWGGDTVAVSQPPTHMEMALPGRGDGTHEPTPAPEATPLPAPPPPPPPAASAKGGPGLRSLALLDALGDSSPGEVSVSVPAPSDKTERLDLDNRHVEAVYGKSVGLQRRAGELRFGEEAEAEQPTLQHAAGITRTLPPDLSNTPNPEDTPPPGSNS
ncbi:MAG: glycosyltransferase family 4 protein [Myxococcota bacterium]